MSIEMQIQLLELELVTTRNEEHRELLRRKIQMLYQELVATPAT